MKRFPPHSASLDLTHLFHEYQEPRWDSEYPSFTFDVSTIDPVYNDRIGLIVPSWVHYK